MLSLFAAFTAGTLVDLIRNGWAGSAKAEKRCLWPSPRKSAGPTPFVPMLPAVATTDTEIQGWHIGKDEGVIIGVYGTNTDPNEWENLSSCNPECFLGREDLKTQEDYEKITAFIPQGGGRGVPATAALVKRLPSLPSAPW